MCGRGRARGRGRIAAAARCEECGVSPQKRRHAGPRPATSAQSVAGVRVLLARLPSSYNRALLLQQRRSRGVKTVACSYSRGELGGAPGDVPLSGPGLVQQRAMPEQVQFLCCEALCEGPRIAYADMLHERLKQRWLQQLTAVAPANAAFLIASDCRSGTRSWWWVHFRSRWPRSSPRSI